jgi:hypothetical protein
MRYPLSAGSCLRLFVPTQKGQCGQDCAGFAVVTMAIIVAYGRPSTDDAGNPGAGGAATWRSGVSAGPPMPALGMVGAAVLPMLNLFHSKPVDSARYTANRATARLLPPGQGEPTHTILRAATAPRVRWIVHNKRRQNAPHFRVYGLPSTGFFGMAQGGPEMDVADSTRHSAFGRSFL